MKKVNDDHVSNVWNQIQLFCNNHEEPMELELVPNDVNMKEPYFCCKDEGCIFHHYAQRITFRDFELMNERLESAMFTMGVMFDMTNYTFSLPRKDPAKELKIKVIKASGRHIKLGIQ